MADDLVGLIGSAINASKKLKKPLGAVGHLFHHGNRAPSANMPIPTPDQVQAEMPQAPADAPLDPSMLGDSSPVPMQEDSISSMPDDQSGDLFNPGPKPPAPPEPTGMPDTMAQAAPPQIVPQAQPIAPKQAARHAAAQVPMDEGSAPQQAPVSQLLQILLAQQMAGYGPQIPNPNTIDPTHPHMGPPMQPTIGPNNPTIGPVRPQHIPTMFSK